MSRAEDALEIGNLISAYESAMDAGDFTRAAGIMADAELTREGHPEVTRGADLAETYRNRLRLHDGSPRTRHVVTNLRYEFSADGTHATVHSYFTVLQAVPGELPLQVVSGGTYRDELDSTGGRWRFTGRHASVDFTGDTSRLYQ
jgi:SnoaL-like domain